MSMTPTGGDGPVASPVRGSGERAASVWPGPLTSHRWVFTLTVVFLFAASVLRSVLAFDDGRRLVALGMLAVWLVLLLSEPALSRRWRGWFVVSVAGQAAAVGVALTLSDASDFFAILLAVPAMQATMRWRLRDAAILIALFGVLTQLALIGNYGAAQAATFVAIYAGAQTFLAAYALTTKRATEARRRNEELASELRRANDRLADHAARAERLATVRERQRLARDLHDSVTQTLFSMTLTARSARLLLERSPAQVTGQLDQIDDLARGALAEMTALSAELPLAVADDDLAAALAAHVRERERSDGLSVTVEVEGGGEGEAVTSPTETAALLRIVQEALNNVVKHADTPSASVRLRLRVPRRLEIEDDGKGFDPRRAGGRGLGLGGMRERAAEIGWTLAVESAPGTGTRVIVEEDVGEEDGGAERGVAGEIAAARGAARRDAAGQPAGANEWGRDSGER